MSDISLDYLWRSVSKTQIVQQIEAYCGEKKLPVSMWLKDSIPRTIIAAFASVLEEFYTDRKNLVKVSLLSYSYGDYLSMLAWEVFQILRGDPTFAIGGIKLTDTGKGPYYIRKGQLWVGSPNNLYYTNIEEGTLEKNGELYIKFQAQESGALYNSAPVNSSWTWRGNPLAGVIISNPETEIGSGTWLFSPGVDMEPDESVKDRCRSKWASQGMGLNEEAWVYHVKSTSSSVLDVKVITNPNKEAGKTRIVISGEDGAFAEDSDVIATIDTRAQQIKTISTKVDIVSATNVIVPIQAKIYVKAGYGTEVSTYVFGSDTVKSVLKEYQKTLRIGGNVYVSKIVSTLQNIRSDVFAVDHVTLSNPLVDITLGQEEVCFLSFSSTSISIEEI